MKNNIKNHPTRAAVCGALALCPLLALATQANATAIAYSALEVENASINAGAFGNFDTFEFTSFTLSTTLNGTTVNSPGTQVSNVSGGTTNQIQLTQGDTPFASDNQYFGANAPTYEGQGDFAIADTHQTNTLLAAGTGNFGTQAGAQVGGGPKQGSADTGTSNSLSWIFTVDPDELTDNALDVILEFDTTRIFYAETNEAGDTARATLDMSVQLFDSEGNLVDSDTIFDLTTNLQDPAVFGSPTSIGESFISTLTLFGAGEYTLNILYDSSAQVQSGEQAVPEPGTVAMFGLGLLAVGAAYRRRKSTT